MTDGAPPLDGVRVLDLTAWQAGPVCAMLLGDYGADVIKIEAPQRLDGWRGAAGLMVDKAYERNPLWNAVNRSKRGHLARPGVRRRAAAVPAPRRRRRRRRRELHAAGARQPRLGYDVLRATNPRIVVASLSGFGQTGPWRDYVAFAFPTEEVSGLAALDRRAGRPAGPAGRSRSPTRWSATMGTLAIVAALERRAATGEGDVIDLSQIEVLTTYLGRRARAGPGHRPRPASGAATSAPGCARTACTRASRPGSAVAIAVPRRRRLAAAVRGDRTARPRRRRRRWRPSPGARAQRARVDDAVAAWTATRDGTADRGARCRPPACPPPSPPAPSELAADEQLWSRGFFRILERPEVGAHPFPGPIVGLHATPAVIERPAPSYGQHTDEVLRDLLGLGDDEIAALHAAGVTSTEPLAQDWR